MQESVLPANDKMKADVPAGRWKLWMDANFCQQKRKRYMMTLKVVIISQMHSIHNTEKIIYLPINSLSLAVIDRYVFPCISEDFPRQPIEVLWYVVDITDANVQQWCDAIVSTWDEFQDFVFCTCWSQTCFRNALVAVAQEPVIYWLEGWWFDSWLFPKLLSDASVKVWMLGRKHLNIETSACMNGWIRCVVYSAL